MREYKRVCIVNNAYVLFQYFLLSSREEITSTYFIFTEDISEIIASKFDHSRLCLPTRSWMIPFYLLYLKLASDIKWPFFRTCEFWGQDNLLITSPLLKDRQIILPEDGLLNYTFKPARRKFRLLRKLLFGNLLSENPLGYSKNVSKIYLTGIKPIPEAIKDKVEIVRFGEIWKHLEADYKEYICSVFNICTSDIEFFVGKDNILFTQPLSEDAILPEDEKVRIYKKIIDEIPGKVVIKTHPREKTNYYVLFPECDVFSAPIPLELLSLVGVQFNNVYTLFSSAVFNLPYKANIHWLGSYDNKYLKEKYGDTLDIMVP